MEPQQFTMTPQTNYSHVVLRLSNTGIINTLGSDSDPYSIKPILYLKSNVKIVDGIGTIDAPFILEA